ncbi:MAG: acetate kinase [Anaerolineae bacterium]|nr:acetate kinase [Anaerolineae bacterium]MCB9105897.1 acetate kinase [Anaerolineales bacterium]
MKILVINSGSSSIKYQLFEMTGHQVLTTGLVERIGQDGSRIKHTRFFEDGRQQTVDQQTAIKNHHQGLAAVAGLLIDETHGVINSPSEIAAVGHRVVHGGKLFSQTTVITPTVIAKVRELSPFAPLHNPPNLAGIEVATEIFPDATQVAVFDTAFHQTMPAQAHRYAIPNDLYERGIRVYGFHGTSHLYVSKKAAEYLGQPVAETNLITIHLGNGCSITAVRGGQSIDTSMGFSPLPGLMMGTRSGDIDPAVVFYLIDKVGMSMEEVDRLLNKQSGLLGICDAIDLRDIEARQAKGDPAAQLALDMYTYRIKKYIGAYMAALGRVDALVFTAGVGENSAYVRRHACDGLDLLGVSLDQTKNETAKGLTEIQANGSRVKVLIVPTNEELEIAMQTLALIEAEDKV